ITNTLTGVPSNNTSFEDEPVLGGVGGFEAQGNYDMSLAVDPTNPAVIYVGGTHDGPPTGFLRVDTTFLHDAHSFYEDDNAAGGGLRRNADNPVVLKKFPNGARSTFFPNAIDNPYINLIRDPR